MWYACNNVYYCNILRKSTRSRQFRPKRYYKNRRYRKKKEEWITEFAKNVCETDLKLTDPDPFHFKANGDYHYIYELLIYEDYEIYQQKCNYTFNQIAIAHHNNFYLFSVYLLVKENPNNDNNYNPEKAKRSQLYISKIYASVCTFTPRYYD